MLNLEKSQFHLVHVKAFPIHSTIDTVVDGQGLAFVFESGVAKVKPSTATANEMFAGFALSRMNYPSKVLVVETLTAVTTTLTLTYAPVTPSTDMRLVTAAGAGLTYGSASNAGEYSVSSNVATLNSAQSGLTITATYKRSISVDEAARTYMQGPQISSQESSSVTRMVDVIRRGVVYTDQFIAADNWAGFLANAQIVSTASGLLTTQSVSGGKLNGKPIEAPSVNTPWLGVEFDAVGTY